MYSIKLQQVFKHTAHTQSVRCFTESAILNVCNSVKAFTCCKVCYANAYLKALLN